MGTRKNASKNAKRAGKRHAAHKKKQAKPKYKGSYKKNMYMFPMLPKEGFNYKWVSEAGGQRRLLPTKECKEIMLLVHAHIESPKRADFDRCLSEPFVVGRAKLAELKQLQGSEFWAEVLKDVPWAKDLWPETWSLMAAKLMEASESWFDDEGKTPDYIESRIARFGHTATAVFQFNALRAAIFADDHFGGIVTSALMAPMADEENDADESDESDESEDEDMEDDNEEDEPSALTAALSGLNFGDVDLSAYARDDEGEDEMDMEE